MKRQITIVINLLDEEIEEIRALPNWEYCNDFGIEGADEADEGFNDIISKMDERRNFDMDSIWYQLHEVFCKIQNASPLEQLAECAE